jgi:hypothetical protein
LSNDMMHTNRCCNRKKQQNKHLISTDMEFQKGFK